MFAIYSILLYHMVVSNENDMVVTATADISTRRPVTATVLMLCVSTLWTSLYHHNGYHCKTIFPSSSVGLTQYNSINIIIKHMSGTPNLHHIG